MIWFATGLIAVSLIGSMVSEKAQALITTNQIGDGAITTKKMADGAVTTPKLADQSITASKITGVTKLIFATCSINFGPINPHADGLTDCSVPGTASGDNVVATPNGLFDVLSFYTAVTLDGKVRLLVHNNADIVIPASSTTWSVIVFHK